MQIERFTLFPAVFLLLIQDEKVLMLRRYNTGYEDGNYTLPAGHMDGGEPATIAMAREAKEEAGVTILPQDLSLVHTMHCLTNREGIHLFFIASQWTGEITNPEPEKCDDISWFPITTLPENTIPYVREAIKHWQNNVPFSEFGWNK